MALLITLFLVLVNIFNNVNTNSPKAEGLTAIEIWMLACILFVFGALVVYAVVLYLKQKKSLDASQPCNCEVRLIYSVSQKKGPYDERPFSLGHMLNRCFRFSLLSIEIIILT